MRRTTRQEPRGTNRSFTLIELMVASAILVTALGAFLVTFNSILKGANYSQGISLASAACLNKLEEIVAHDFSSIREDYSANGTPGNTFDFNTSAVLGITGIGSINITDRTDLYGGGMNHVTASLPRRRDHTSVVYDNKMWVIGGDTGAGYLNGVLWSNDTDGSYQMWYTAITNATWPARGSHTSLVYDNKMWVMGGSPTNTTYLNDIWYSVDGENWNRATANATWSARSEHTSLVYDNKMWVMGGYNGTYLNDIWYSIDSMNWTQAPANANWSGRAGHSSVVYDNKMWVMGGSSGGGGYLNDIWYSNSTDGSIWTQVTTTGYPGNDIWSARADHASVVYDNKMWVIWGGGSTSPNDVWWTDDLNFSDNQTWTQASPPTWPDIRSHTSLVYDNKMWVILGGSVPGTNDVWYSAGYDRILEVLITVCWRQPDGRMFGNVTNCVTSPAQLRVLLSEKNITELRKTFLGRQE